VSHQISPREIPFPPAMRFLGEILWRLVIERCPCCRTDESSGSLQRSNSTPDLLDDHRRPPPEVTSPEVTSPDDDFRSLRAAMVTTKIGVVGAGASQLASARAAVGGSAGTLLDAADRPPPPIRGLSTFSGSGLDQRTTLDRNGRASPSGNRQGSVENLPRSSRG